MRIPLSYPHDIYIILISYKYPAKTRCDLNDLRKMQQRKPPPREVQLLLKDDLQRLPQELKELKERGQASYLQELLEQHEEKV
jgi:hypothetical protein